MKEWKIGSEFVYKNLETHTVKNLIEDTEGQLIIAENGEDYGYTGESDKFLMK